jgi:4-carboxymuconolactone decarboxylase
MNAQNDINLSQSLNTQQQSIVCISALTAIGDLEQLKTQLNIGLDVGLSINEIKEILVQLYAYAGFPRSLNGINTFMKVLEERKSKDISDNAGKETTVQKSSIDKYEQGRKVLEVLTKTTQKKPAPGFGEFAPRIDAFLKEHLFADIFESDILTYQQRELVTISALSSMTGVEGQLQAHLRMGKNTGLTNEQLLNMAELIEKYISRKQADTLRNSL